MRPVTLTPDVLAEALQTLPAWQRMANRDAIHKSFHFKDFSEAFAFMTRVAMAAEKLDHHPEWSNVYRTVEVTLTTHDAGGVTSLDIALARLIDSYAA